MPRRRLRQLLCSLTPALLVAVFGCEARLPLGNRCLRSSECADGLACVIGGFCREECTVSRDCSLGARCLPDPATGLRACSLSTVDDGCTDGSCVVGLTCVAGACQADCRGDADCPDGRCASGTCVPDLGGDAGAPADAPVQTDAPVACATTPGAALLDVAVGGRHACAITADHQVWCWGSREGITDDATAAVGCGGDCYVEPVRIVTASGPLTGATHLALGDFGSCAILEDTRVACWGDGPLGAARPATDVAVIVERTTGAELTGVTELDAGRAYFCAIAAGTVYCWGQGGFGQLGTGTIDDVLRATEATELAGAASGLVLASVRTNVLIDGMIVGVGEDDDGELGGSAPSTEFSLTGVVATRAPGAERIIQTAENVCAVRGGVPSCWGGDSWVLDDAATLESCGGTCTLTPWPATITGALTVVGWAGDPIGGAILGWTDAGDLVGWGGNLDNVLDPDSGISVVPTVSLRPALGGRPTHDVDLENMTACALLDSGEVWCWGRNDYAQLGRGAPGATDGRGAPVCW